MFWQNGWISAQSGVASGEDWCYPRSKLRVFLSFFCHLGFFVKPSQATETSHYQNDKNYGGGEIRKSNSNSSQIVTNEPALIERVTSDEPQLLFPGSKKAAPS